ncbi:MAG: uracil-DNA glycosylase [Bacilli bacterium]
MNNYTAEPNYFLWKGLLSEINNKSYFKELLSFLEKEYAEKTIFPPSKDLFKSFLLCKEENLKVVIIGQDPYHEINQANGLAFSVNKGIKLPPSLKNIYKEIENEYNVKTKNDGDLTYLAKQGVLLLNKYLSVEEGKPLSHKNKLYDEFFKDVISYIESINKPIVFMLWGGEAKKVKPYIANKLHIILEANHPSPLSANRGGWFDSKIFLRCNEYLKKFNVEEIDWTK